MPDFLDRLKTALADRYAIEREIGAGGMATVYLAEDLKHERQVAVKVLHPELAAALGPERFLREIKVTAKLTHPHILPVHDSGEADGFLYYVMPFIEGESLRQLMLRERQLPIGTAVQLAREVAEALDHAHRNGVVHRDIKPENVLISEGHAVIADFGIARAIHEAGGERLTETGLAIGTPAYMSPEQVSADRVIDGRTDVYSLGGVLYEMLTGEAPHTGATVEVILAKRLTNPAPSARSIRPSVPKELDESLQRALALSPADRWSTAADFARHLNLLPTQHRKTVSAMTRLGRRPVAAAVVIVLLGIIGWLLTRGGDSPLAGRPEGETSDVVAVFPFSVSGGDDIAYLGEGMVDFLGTALDGVGEIRTVDPFAVLSLVRETGSSAPDPDEARSLARRLGANRYIIGSVFEVGNRLRIRAVLYGSEGDLVESAEVRLSTESEIFEVVDNLARELVATYLAGRETRLPALAARTTSSLPALKEYLEGERAFRASEWAGAIEPLQRAVGLDSTFALAWYRMSAAAHNTFQDSLARYAIEQAVRLVGKLSARDRRMVAGMDEWITGNGLEAARIYQGIVTSYPVDLEAWLNLGELQWHHYPLHGLSADESRSAFERAVAIQPRNTDALLHLRHLAAWDNRWTEYDSLVTLLFERSPDHFEAPVTRAERAFALGDESAQLRSLQELATVGDALLTLSTVAVALVTEDPAKVARIARLLTQPQRRPGVWAGGHIMLAYLFGARGQWREALRELASAEPLDSVTTLEHRALLSSLPFLEVTAGELEHLRSRLMAWNPGNLPSTEGADGFFWHQGMHPQLRAYLIGLLSARVGDDATAIRYADELETMDDPVGAGSIAFDLSVDIRAQVALLRGQPQAALERLEAARMEVSWPRQHLSPIHSRSLQRYVRGVIAAESHLIDPAVGWLDTEWNNTYDLIYIAPSHLRLARMFDDAGDETKAIEHYTRFVELWQDSDSELQPLVDDARARLADLTARE